MPMCKKIISPRTRYVSYCLLATLLRKRGDRKDRRANALAVNKKNKTCSVKISQSCQYHRLSTACQCCKPTYEITHGEVSGRKKTTSSSWTSRYLSGCRHSTSYTSRKQLGFPESAVKSANVIIHYQLNRFCFTQ